MATLPVSVAPGGGGSGLVSYPSMALAIANCEVDTGATGADDVEITAEGTWGGVHDTTQVNLSASPHVAAKLIIVPTANNRYNGVYDPNIYTISTVGEALIGSARIEINGLQIQSTVGGGGVGAAEIGGGGAGDVVLFDGCWFKSPSGGAGVVSFAGAIAQLLIRNSVVQDSTYGFASIDSPIVCHNTTVRGVDRGYSVLGSTLTAVNSIADTAAVFGFDGSVTGSNNASADATAPGVGSIINATFDFESAVSMLLSRNDLSGAIDGGTSLKLDPTLPVIKDILLRNYLNPPSMGVNQVFLSSAGLEFGINF